MATNLARKQPRMHDTHLRKRRNKRKGRRIKACLGSQFQNFHMAPLPLGLWYIMARTHDKVYVCLMAYRKQKWDLESQYPLLGHVHSDLSSFQ